MEPVTLNNSVDIILTPQFYTLIREDLELKFAYQAKQIAPSLFDDYLNNVQEYQYHVNKCDTHWCFIAYNIDEIDTFLNSVGIEKHRVSKIYFAQQIANVLKEPILLNDREVLQTIDETVTLIPKRLMEPDLEYKSLNIEDLKISNGVSMGASLNSFVSLKETILLGSLLFTLGTAFIVEGTRTKSSIASENERLGMLLDENPKYTNSTLRKSVLEKYQPLDKIERNKRQSLKDLSKFLSANSQLKELTINDSKIEATIATANETIKKQVIEHTKAKNFKSIITGLNVKVEKKI